MAAALIAGTAGADFAIEDDGSGLTVLEDGRKVLRYNYGRVDPPEGSKADPARYWRSSYVHPLYGLDGDVLTQDFPRDHYHHRGVYWTWPHCKAGERDLDIWTIVGVRQLFQEWLAKEAGDDAASVAVKNAWIYDDDPEPKVEETVRFTVHPATEHGQAIDFHLTFKNVCKETVLIRGSTDIDPRSRIKKGYGGFCLRPDAERKPLTFTAADGVVKHDVLHHDSPWADVSMPIEKRGGPVSGAAIFQHPNNLDYPHDGWIFRHYGFLGASWPHAEGHALAPGESVDLRYRLYVHRGDAEAGRVAQAFAAFAKQHGAP